MSSSTDLVDLPRVDIGQEINRVLFTRGMRCHRPRTQVIAVTIVGHDHWTLISSMSAQTRSAPYSVCAMSFASPDGRHGAPVDARIARPTLGPLTPCGGDGFRGLQGRWRKAALVKEWKRNRPVHRDDPSLNPRPSGAPPLSPARYDDEARALKVLDQALGYDLRHEFIGIGTLAGRENRPRRAFEQRSFDYPTMDADAPRGSSR